MDLKNYSSDKDLLEYFFEKINLCSDENFEKIFSSYEDKEKDFIGIISRTLIELDPFIKILCQFFEAFYKNNVPWIKFKNTTLNICKSIHDITKDKCDNIFLNFCLNYVLDMIEKNKSKTGFISHKILNKKEIKKNNKTLRPVSKPKQKRAYSKEKKELILQKI